MYPNLVAEMARAGETTEDLGKMLELDRSQVYRRKGKKNENNTKN